MTDLFTLTEQASAKVTANGRPSGTATTSTVTPIMKNLTNCCKQVMFHGFPWMASTSMQNRRISISMVSMATAVPATTEKPGRSSKVKVRILIFYGLARQSRANTLIIRQKQQDGARDDLSIIHLWSHNKRGSLRHNKLPIWCYGTGFMIRDLSSITQPFCPTFSNTPERGISTKCRYFSGTHQFGQFKQ